jgi:acyl-CoA oxidase
MESAFDPSELNVIWEPQCQATRRAIKAVFSEPLFDRQYGLSLSGMNDLTLRRLRRVAELGVVSPTDFETCPANVFSTQEVLSTYDGALATKFTVQYNLFGGTVVGLGTERHRDLVPHIAKMQIVGCFALTELGYGNNAVEMETTATWDADTMTFDIHTPRTLASKYWITNGALHAHFSVVFARLIYHGNDEGIHAFLVRIRHPDLTPCEGVEIEDMGIKMGMNGLDNARLRFRHVKVPREALLNKNSDIDADGKFRADVVRKRDRFLRVADRLLSGRICLASMMTGSSRQIAYIAFKFAQDRLLAGPTGKTDTPLIDFQNFQLAMIPKFARILGLNIGLTYVVERFTAKDPEIIKLCCVIKPLLAWSVEQFACTARERIGCHGLMEANLIIDAISQTHAAQTAEGDSAVLMVKVATEILKEHAKGTLRLPEMKLDLETQIPNMTDFESLDLLVELFKAREVVSFRELIDNFQVGAKRGKSQFSMQMQDESDRIQMLARAYGERVCIESVMRVIERHPTLADILALIGHLFALDSIRSDLAWFIMHGLVSPAGAANINARWEACTAQLKPHIWKIIESFELPVASVNAPAATGLGAFYSEKLRPRL